MFDDKPALTEFGSSNGGWTASGGVPYLQALQDSWDPSTDWKDTVRVATLERRYPSMFEPVHGSAPDIAGQAIANPIGAIWSASLMLEHLGLATEAQRVMRAIESVTSQGSLTPDLGGTCRTSEVTDAIIAAVTQRAAA